MLRQKIKLNIVGEIENLGIIKDLVKQTLAMSFLPGWCITTELENQSVVVPAVWAQCFRADMGLCVSPKSSAQPDGINPAETLPETCHGRGIEGSRHRQGGSAPLIKRNNGHQ